MMTTRDAILAHSLLLCVAAGIGLGWCWRGDVEACVTQRVEAEVWASAWRPTDGCRWSEPGGVR